MPNRLQLSRKKGFRLPRNAKSVARPSRFGNPFIVWRNREWYADTWDAPNKRMGDAIRCYDNRTARKIATEAYAAAVKAGWRGYDMPQLDEIRLRLRGLDLACWCQLPEPGETDWCHARVLIDIANEENR